MPQKVLGPDDLPLSEIDARYPVRQDGAHRRSTRVFRIILRITRLPLPLRRLIWLIGLNFGRQRANFFGSFGVTSVAPFGPGELHALMPGAVPAQLWRCGADQTINVIIRWDHRITDAALIAKALTRLEQLLNTEISAELLADRHIAGPKPVRTAITLSI